MRHAECAPCPWGNGRLSSERAYQTRRISNSCWQILEVVQNRAPFTYLLWKHLLYKHASSTHSEEYLILFSPQISSHPPCCATFCIKSPPASSWMWLHWKDSFNVQKKNQRWLKSKGEESLWCQMFVILQEEIWWLTGKVARGLASRGDKIKPCLTTPCLRVVTHSSLTMRKISPTMSWAELSCT